MANHRRGEVDAVLAGHPFVLCLTLGALAELEASFGAEDIDALGRRLGAGRLSARDLQRILVAAVRGGPRPEDAARIGTLPLAGGLPALVDAAVRVLDAAFGTGPGGPGDESPSGADTPPRP
jgi:hypothetical protein